jgi:hypothetical protein
MNQLAADSSQELQVLSVTCMPEFIVNNVDRKLLEMADVLSTML